MHSGYVEELQQAREHRTIKGVVKLEVLVFTHHSKNHHVLQIVNTVVVIALVLCQIRQDVIHKTLTEDDREHRIHRLRDEPP